MEVSDEQVSRFQENGFIVIERIISEVHVERILAGMNRVYNGVYERDMRPPALRKHIEPHTKADTSVRWILHSRLLDPDLWNFATDPALACAAARLLLAPSVSIMEDQLLDKPGPGAPVALHQDYTYWRFSTSPNIISCWFALSDMTPEMGPVEAVPGSHRWGIVDNREKFVNRNDQEYALSAQAMMPVGTTFDPERAIVPKAGGIFFHGLTLHGSRGNLTTQCRRAITLHWASSDCRYNPSRMAEYGYPHLFSGLKDGDLLVNKYMPRVYPSELKSQPS